MSFITDSVKDVLPAVLSGAGTGSLAWFFARRKNNAEIQASELDNVEKATLIWRQLAEDMKNEVKELRDRLETVYQENQELKKQVEELTDELHDLRK